MTGLVESQQARPGDAVVSCDSPIGRLGLSICYDVRFPELYQVLAFEHKASILLVPSAFACKTGQAHWEILLRSRAIETQCYIIAAAQVGLHNSDGNRRKSWGNAMAIDPWGKIVAHCGCDSEKVAIFGIDSALIDTTRENMPIQAHRRPGIYRYGIGDSS